MPRRKVQLDRAREQIAQEAARIMHEQMVRDFHQAKIKACERLGFSGKTAMPRNEEIQSALTRYLQVFKSQTQPALLNRLRGAALQAMEFLDGFEPRLVGSVLDGTADDHSAVQLHVFAETPEQLFKFLMERGIPYEISMRRVHYGRDRDVEVSACRFLAGDVPVELVIFTPKGLREAPRSPVDGRPMARAKRGELEKLIECPEF
jgi:predicted nucleotidyltransferase